jgi:tRNA(fMet)-specific endonuclease VapC
MPDLYLLDTNTVSHLIKRHPKATERLLAVPMHQVCISAITAGELAFGLAKRPAAIALHHAVKEFLQHVAVLP